MCVGEVAHLRVLVSIISDFLHMQHSMFGSHMRARTGCVALMYETAFNMRPCRCLVAGMRCHYNHVEVEWGEGQQRQLVIISQISDCRKIECDGR